MSRIRLPRRRRLQTCRVVALRGLALDPAALTGVLFWVSIFALPLLVLSLVALVVAAIRRTAKRDVGTGSPR
jgi:hypothetical protein